MTSQSKNNRLLSLTVIEAAAGGDVEAINAVLKHYAGYIARLSACGLLCADFQHPGALPAFCREAVPKQPGMITAVVCKALD